MIFAKLKPIMERKLILGVLLGCLAASPLRAEILRGEIACGGLSAAASGVSFGPFDYRHGPRDKLQMVETYHFSANVRNLRKGQSSTVLGSDIDFALRYFPNHIRALNSMAQLARREKSDHPRGARYGMDCWFDRAVRFAPDDNQVRLLYGIWLAKKGERALALEQLDQVREAVDRSPSMSYNLGLAYCETEDFDKALDAAHEAYTQGFNLPGLRNRLTKAGKWREPPAPAANAADEAGDAKTSDATAATASEGPLAGTPEASDQVMGVKPPAESDPSGK